MAHAQTTSPAARPSAETSGEPAQIGPALTLVSGKSTLLRLPQPIDRISVGNPSVADVTLISQREVYFLGKALGTTNVIIWSKTGQATVIDVSVGVDLSPLENELALLLPDEKDIKVVNASGSIVLRGIVADAVKVDQAVAIAEAWRARLTRDLVLPVQTGQGSTTISVGGGSAVRDSVAAAGPRIINMLRVRDAQQVMLEVKVAEVSKKVLERIGVTLGQQGTAGGSTFTFLSQSNFLNQLLGAAAITRQNIFDRLQIDAQKDDGLVKMLAQPTIMAISGQEASFRAGGRIFIPVARENNVTGGATLTLEEKEFGVGVKFKPTVLEGGRINLKVAPEVSELNSTGSPFTTVGGVTSVIPSFTVRRAETTVQLNDGQSFMIAGLVKHDVAESVNRFPGLGEIPILGALFRSSEFQQDKTELMFVITPRLVRPLPPGYALPTDAHVEPSRSEFFLEGKMEGEAPPIAAQPPATSPAGQGGFQRN
jgi:pilus assembly protein CpaC